MSAGKKKISKKKKKAAGKAPAKVKVAAKSPAKIIPAASVQPVEVAGLSVGRIKAPGKKPPGFWLAVVGVGVIVIGTWIYPGSPNPEEGNVAPGAVVPKPPPVEMPAVEWGDKVDIEVAGKFSIMSSATALQADEKGGVYVVANPNIEYFVDGKLKKKLVIGTKPGQGLASAFDGKYLYVAPVHSDNVIVIPADLSGEKLIKVPGATSISAIAVGPGGNLYVSCQGTQQMIMTNRRAQALGRFEATRWISDIGFSKKDEIFTHNHLLHRISRFSKAGINEGDLKVPWSTATWEHMVVLNDAIFINGFTQGQLFAQDIDGSNLRSARKIEGVPLDQFQVIAAGRDGFLYLLNRNVVYKIKPI